VSLAVCTLIWGTTWLVIKLQAGRVDPIVSICWRFALSGVVIFLISAARGRRISLTRRQHVYALAQGVLVFGFGYELVYLAETHAVSAVVAVAFATLALFNTAVFRLVLGIKASRAAWFGATIGVVGVGLLSAGQIIHAPVKGDIVLGVALTLGSVVFNAFGNVCTRLSLDSGAQVWPSTGWAMVYGATATGLYGLFTGVSFAPPMDPGYWLAFVYLSLLGSVAGFLLYYGVASRRGFTLASYVGVMTPPVAMIASSLVEKVQWDLWAFVGLACIVAGQFLIIRQNAQKSGVAAPSAQPVAD